VTAGTNNLVVVYAKYIKEKLTLTKNMQGD